MHNAHSVLKGKIGVGKAYRRLPREEHLLREGCNGAYLFLLEEVYASAGKGLEHIGKLHEEAHAISPVAAPLGAHTVSGKAREEATHRTYESFHHILIHKLGGKEHHRATNRAGADRSPVIRSLLPPAVILTAEYGVEDAALYLNADPVADKGIESVAEKSVDKSEIEARLRREEIHAGVVVFVSLSLMCWETPGVFVKNGKKHIRELLNKDRLLGIDERKDRHVLDEVASFEVFLLVKTSVTRLPEELPLGIRKRLDLKRLAHVFPIAPQLVNVFLELRLILEPDPKFRILSST